MLQNMHIHSKYSWDSEMDIYEIAQILYEKGIRYGALTDHIEFDREPLEYVLKKFKIRNIVIDTINNQYSGKLTLMKAVEISSPHLYKDKVKALDELEMDFIMGSIHKVETKINTSYERTYNKYLYYSEMLKMVEAKQIDVVGHLDYIDRYDGYSNYSCYQVSDLISAIIENNMILEVNTSSKRRANIELFPSINKLCDYKVLNGDNVIIGSDAHQYNELLDNIDFGEKIVKDLSLKPIIYQKRKRINIKA